MITDPITLGPDKPIHAALELMAEFSISGVPITEGKRLVGILTNRDLRFCRDTTRPVREVMTSETWSPYPRAPTWTPRRRSCTSTASRSCWWSTTRATCAA